MMNEHNTVPTAYISKQRAENFISDTNEIFWGDIAKYLNRKYAPMKHN